MSRSAQAQGAAWFIQAAGKVWGPYPESRMASFIEEGRVAAETLVGPTAEGPFTRAASQGRLHRLFGEDAAAPEPLAEPERQDQPVATVAPTTDQAPRPSVAGAARPLLVWAQLRSRRADALEALIGAHGPFVRVQPGLWLVRVRESPAALRNALTRRLESDDRLMVVAAPLSDAAWFNLDGDTDRTLRQLWVSAD